MTEIVDKTPAMEEQMDTLTFIYRNYRGEVSERRVRDPQLVFGENDWHKAPQWILVAFDIDKNAERWFALEDILTPMRKTT